MAVGFAPKYAADLPLYDLTQEQAIVIIVAAVEKMGWKTSYVSPSGLIAHTDNGMFARNSEIHIKIESSIANLKSVTTGTEIWDAGKNKKNINGLIGTFEELKTSLTPEEIAAKYHELKEGDVIKDDEAAEHSPHTSTAQITNFFSVFRPVKGFFITPLIIDINILLFVIMVASGVNFLSPDNESLLKWGANFRPLTLEGEWWRLITNTFLHIGIFHLLFNMYALLYIGLLLEPHLGKARFLAAYLLTGLTASMASLWWHDLIISAGASGAIFGMYGVFLAMLTGNFIEKNTRKSLLASIGLFVVYNLVNGTKGGVDNAAHIGGLVGGIIIGYAFMPSLKKPGAKNLEFSTIGILAVAIIVASSIVYKNIPNDIGKYEVKIQAFVANEEKALEVYKLPKGTPKSVLLDEIKNKGIFYWNEDIKLTDEIEKLKIPDIMHERNKKLRQYCELRLKSYELLYKAMDENTDDYNSQIEDYNKQIADMIDSLKEKKE